jgi:hypothetical protein
MIPPSEAFPWARGPSPSSFRERLVDRTSRVEGEGRRQLLDVSRAPGPRDRRRQVDTEERGAPEAVPHGRVLQWTSVTDPRKGSNDHHPPRVLEGHARFGRSRAARWGPAKVGFGWRRAEGRSLASPINLWVRPDVRVSVDRRPSVIVARDGGWAQGNARPLTRRGFPSSFRSSTVGRYNNNSLLHGHPGNGRRVVSPGRRAREPDRRTGP